MANWIDLNIPWSVTVDLPEPDYPVNSINIALLKEFGYTKNEFLNSSRHILDLEQQVLDQLYNSALSEDDITKLMETSNDTKIVSIREHHKKRKQINSFIDTIPEVIKWNQEMDIVRKNEAEIRAASCFSYSKYNIPGTIIVLKTKIGTKTLLIGDINKNGCAKFGESDIEDNDIIIKCLDVLPLLINI